RRPRMRSRKAPERRWCSSARASRKHRAARTTSPPSTTTSRNSSAHWEAREDEMTDFLQLMALPFVACLILTGIHAYLGLHVIEREVIFVDLALAQIAAFGGALAVLFGHGLESGFAYWM